MSERNVIKIVVTPAHLKFEGRDSLEDYIAAGRTNLGTSVEEVTDAEQPLGGLNRGMLNFARKMVGSRPVNFGVSAVALTSAIVAFQAFHQENQDVAYADGLIAVEGTYTMVGPTLMGAGEISADSVVAIANGKVADGFKVDSIWRAIDGVLHSYIPGAPDFVNDQPTSFRTVPSREPIIFVVGKGEKPFVEAFDRDKAKRVGDILNRLRTDVGLKPRDGVSSQLQNAVDSYNLFLSKIDPLPVGPSIHNLDGSPQNRADRAGYHGLATELIVYNLSVSTTAEEIVKFFVDSPDHNFAIYGTNPSTKDMAISIYNSNKSGFHLEVVIVNFGIPR